MINLRKTLQELLAYLKQTEGASTSDLEAVAHFHGCLRDSVVAREFLAQRGLLWPADAVLPDRRVFNINWASGPAQVKLLEVIGPLLRVQRLDEPERPQSGTICAIGLEQVVEEDREAVRQTMARDPGSQTQLQWEDGKPYRG
jgi:hypothetical protein